MPLANLRDLDTSALKGDSAPGAPPYDTVLVPPFPEIRVISWRPKLRRPDGEVEKDAFGESMMGKRAWFALDNRRLHSMQSAAAQRWPRRCCVVVRCIEEVPGSDIKELRKFRTTTEGRSVEVGAKADRSFLWRWPMDAPKGVRGTQEVEAEGLCAEDLWDAAAWAPQAIAIAAHLGAREESEASPSPRSGGPSPPPMQRRPVLVECPADSWEYKDPRGVVQGPFGLEKMRLWHQHGFFYPSLPMRCDPSDEFVPFVELWPLGVAPFSIHVIRNCFMPSF